MHVESVFCGSGLREELDSLLTVAVVEETCFQAMGVEDGGEEREDVQVGEGVGTDGAEEAASANPFDVGGKAEGVARPEERGGFGVNLFVGCEKAGGEFAADELEVVLVTVGMAIF